MSRKKPICDAPTGALPDDPGHLLRHLFMALRVQVEEGLRPLGYTLPQFGVMMALKRAPGRSNAELARGAYVTPQAMGEVLTGLEKSKLIRRKPHKDNARLLSSELTPAGEKAMAACLTVIQSVNNRMFSRMSDDNKKAFGALIELCLVGLKDGGEQ